MKIGNIPLKSGAALAPMAGFTDAACRGLMAAHGAAFTVSEMVSAKALCYGDAKTGSLVRWSARPEGVPYGVQLFGAEPETMGRAAALLTRYDFDFFDINMGCPAPKITAGGAGSKLMLNPALCGEIVAAVVQNAGARPVTVKMRTGWDAGHKTAIAVAEQCEASGAAALAVHGRTQEQMYQPGVDFESIAAVKAAVRVPVFGNGDVASAADALAMLQKTGCDGVMVGRAALGNPWLFEDIAAALAGQPEPKKPALAARMAALRAQIYEMCDRMGEHRAMPPARGQAIHYMQGLRGAAELRRRCGMLEHFSDVDALIADVYRLQKED